tara:strand:- start:101 stop:811 length:711 start_codon:yes stop_codon:yes gene_type:complete
MLGASKVNFGLANAGGEPWVTDGLVMLFDANRSDSYPGSGTTVTDLSGNGYNATLSGVGYSTTTTYSHTGGFFTFDGNDVINGSSNSALNLTGSMTVEVLFYYSSGANDWIRLIGKGDGTNRTYGLWIHPNGTLLYQRYGSTNMNISVGSGYSANNWYHIVGVSNGSSHTFYRDKASIGTSSSGSTFHSSTSALTLGKHPNIHDYHRGGISYAAVYNRALSLSEVTQNNDYISERF